MYFSATGRGDIRLAITNTRTQTPHPLEERKVAVMTLILFLLQGRLPIKWTAPEHLFTDSEGKDVRVSEKSDV